MDSSNWFSFLITIHVNNGGMDNVLEVSTSVLSWNASQNNPPNKMLSALIILQMTCTFRLCAIHILTQMPLQQW